MVNRWHISPQGQKYHNNYVICQTNLPTETPECEADTLPLSHPFRLEFQFWLPKFSYFQPHSSVLDSQSCCPSVRPSCHGFFCWFVTWGLTNEPSCHGLIFFHIFRQKSSVLDSESCCPALRSCCHGPGPEEEDLVQRLQETFHHWQDQEKDGSHFKLGISGCHLWNRL